MFKPLIFKPSIFKPLVIVSLWLPLAAQADIKMLQAGEQAGCQLVAEDVCKTTASAAQQACLERHQQAAAEAGADAVLLGERDESTVRRPSLTGAKNVTTTRIAAQYYDCGLQQAAFKQAVQSAVAEPAAQLSIEQRLVRLQKLKDKGLISADEYQQKRQQILDQL